MKKLCTALIAVIMLIQLMGIIGVADSVNEKYHPSLVTHWDFEGDGDEVYADKASGASSDTLTPKEGIAVNDGVAYVPASADSYLSASGAKDTDLYSMANKTIVAKVALREDENRGVVAAFISKIDCFAYGVQTTHASISYVFYGSKKNTAINSAEHIDMNEFRIFAMTFEYDETAKKGTVKQYVSRNECPTSAEDMVLLTENTVSAPMYEGAGDFILGKRFGHLSQNRNLYAYFDDVKIYSEVLSVNDMIADIPQKTDYIPGQSEQAGASDNIKYDYYYDKLNGITMYAIGDSYFAGLGIGKEKSWPTMLATKYGMEHVNDGVSGTTLAAFNGYKQDALPMVVRYKDTLPSKAADIVLVEGGRNDRSVPVPIGNNDSRDIYTFKGALNVMLDGIAEKYPNALIICVTPWNAMDKTNPSTVDYAKAMVELCEYKGVACINAADPEAVGVDINDAAFRAKYSNGANDYSHLNADGMRLVLPYFEEYIARYYYDHIGAEFADATPNEYYKAEAATVPAAKDTLPTDTATEDTDGELTQPEETSDDALDKSETSEQNKEKSGCGAVTCAPIGMAAAMAAVCGANKKRKHKR